MLKKKWRKIGFNQVPQQIKDFYDLTEGYKEIDIWFLDGFMTKGDIECVLHIQYEEYYEYKHYWNCVNGKWTLIKMEDYAHPTPQLKPYTD